MKTTRILTNGAMALAAVLCLFPANGLADTLFSFSNLGTVGSVTGSGSTEVATITVDDITINGITTFGNSFTETYTNSTGVLTFSGTGTGAVSNLSGAFLTIDEPAGLLGALPLDAVSIYSGVTSLDFSSAFLTDLGLAADPIPGQVTATVSLTAAGMPPDNVSSTLSTFDVAAVTAVPEPSTLTMLGVAMLLGVGISARRKPGLNRSGN